MKTQRGASTLGILIAVLFFGSLITLVIKLGPIYLDDITIQEAIESLNDTDNLDNLSVRDVQTLIRKRLSVNNVDGFDEKLIKVHKEDGKVHIDLEYEVRTDLFQNVDAVVHFNHAYEMTGQ
ncbi:DUF4845 domain-containing protein [Marinobacter sp. R17]|uniref:DUF4845 domain-containing protein n=1 Tax=Marinobacter TaxID=2742 RepID=UPI000F4B22F8|nr:MULTISPECIES: DUF4845 domain-containing protein [Marinobacter]ROT97865.1 DUF4845 domain-containing protein [Marinobacter sp. R17]